MRIRSRSQRDRINHFGTESDDSVKKCLATGVISMLTFHGVYQCPVCDWRVSPIELSLIVYDPICEGCETKHWSQFVPVIMDQES